MQSQARHWCPALTSTSLVSKNSWYPPKRRKTTICLRARSNTTLMGLTSMTQPTFYLVHIMVAKNDVMVHFSNIFLIHTIYDISYNYNINDILCKFCPNLLLLLLGMHLQSHLFSDCQQRKAEGSKEGSNSEDFLVDFAAFWVHLLCFPVYFTCTVCSKFPGEK